MLCGQPADELHHVTARYAGEFLDPELLVPLCKHCHDLVHRACREWGFEAMGDPALARARRLQVLFVFAGYCDEPVLLSPEVCDAVVACLGRVAEALEVRCR
jgi:hypothetical protein